MQKIIEKLLRGEPLNTAERLAIAIQCLGIRKAINATETVLVELPA